MNYKLLLIDSLKPDKDQPRKTINAEKIAGLAQSFKTVGVINAIEVDENNVIITGEQRWRAAKLAGFKEIPCKILKVGTQQRFLRQVIENIHNSTMNDYETGKAFAKLLNWLPRGQSQSAQGNDMGIRKLARQLGINRNYIHQHLKLLQVSKPLLKAMEDNKISFTHIREISTAPKEFQAQLEKKILAGEFAKSNSVTEVAAALSRNPQKAKEILAINYTPLKHTAEVTEVVSKISPRLPDMVKARLAPSQEFTRIKNELISWLEQNPPTSAVKFDRGYLILGLNQIVQKINIWGLQAVPELKGNSDNGN